MQITPIPIDVDYPLWEFQLDLPEGLQEEITNPQIWQDTQRCYLEVMPPKCAEVCQLAVDFQNLLLPTIFDVNSPFERAVRTRWYSGVDINATASILRDKAGQIGDTFLHVDHRNVFCVSILNLVDNPNGTEFWFQGKQIHTGPTRAGHGVTLLNTEHSMHGYLNTTSSDRYICMMNTMLWMRGDYRPIKKIG